MRWKWNTGLFSQFYPLMKRKLLNMLLCLTCRALRVRKKMSGDRMPLKMIGDILTNQLPHMQPYIRFCPRPFKINKKIYFFFSVKAKFEYFLSRAGSVRVSWMVPRLFSRKLMTTLRSKISWKYKTLNSIYIHTLYVPWD